MWFLNLRRRTKAKSKTAPAPAPALKKTPTTIHSLPSEVLDIVAGHIMDENRYIYSRDTLWAASLVSKTFHESFRPLIFKRITIGDSRSDGARSMLESLATVIKANPSIGGYIRDLHFSSVDYEVQEWDKNLFTVTSNVPNVKDFIWCPSVTPDDSAAEDLVKALVPIFTSPTVTSIVILGQMMFALPHRLLFAAPALEKVHIELFDHRSCDLEHWKALESAPVAVGPYSGSPPRKRYLHFRNGYGGRNDWLQYVVQAMPTYFSFLNHFEFNRITQSDIPNIEALLRIAGPQLRHLELWFLPKEPLLPIAVDLSSCTVLQFLYLRYESVLVGNALLCITHDGLPSLESTIATLTSPYLIEVKLHADWECTGKTPQLRPSFPYANLKQLDRAFADLHRRNPDMLRVWLALALQHCEECRNHNGQPERCGVWSPITGTKEPWRTRRELFPYLGNVEPQNLRVLFSSYLGVLDLHQYY